MQYTYHLFKTKIRTTVVSYFLRYHANIKLESWVEIYTHWV